MRNRRLVSAAVAAGMAGVIGMTTAGAATATATLTVSATVSNNCTISTGALAFGTYDPVVANASANLDGVGRVTIACTKGAIATVGLGTGSNGSDTARRMSNGAGSFLTYELYQDSGRTTLWNTGAGLLSPSAAPSRDPRDFPVYARIAANQDVPAGSYTDTVVATVNF